MDFLKYKFLYFTISGALVAASIGALVLWGLKPAIDFTGGTLIEYQLEQFTELDKIRPILDGAQDIDIAGLLYLA